MYNINRFEIQCVGDFTWGGIEEGRGWRKRYDQEEDFTYKQMTSSRKCSRFIVRENLVTL